jgi:hypothetical protein
VVISRLRPAKDNGAGAFAGKALLRLCVLG